MFLFCIYITCHECFLHYFHKKTTVLQLALFCLAPTFMKLITRANLKTPVHNYTSKSNKLSFTLSSYSNFTLTFQLFMSMRHDQVLGSSVNIQLG